MPWFDAYVCFASEGNKTYDINSLEKLNETIEAFEGNKISKTNSEHIIEETSPDVLIEYMDEIDNVAIDYFEKAEPVEKTYDDENDCSIIVYRVQVDPLSSVELVLMDQEESSALNKIGKSIKNIFVDECYAATNGDTMWKKYGKRYYTAKYTRCIGPGYATVCTENHYSISKNGIHERSANSWLDSMTSLTGEITETGYSVFPDAKKAGETTKIRARITFKYTASVEGIAHNSYATIYENLKIKYIKNDSQNKKMKVKYSWSKTNI